MSDCIRDNNSGLCIRCGLLLTTDYRECKSHFERIKGPGDFLHDAILKWVGEGPTRECGCTDRINQMNAWGPEGCRERLQEIVGWLYGEAQRHKWTKLLTHLPGNDYVIRWLVKGAIRAAEREATTPAA